MYMYTHMHTKHTIAQMIRWGPPVLGLCLPCVCVHVCLHVHTSPRDAGCRPRQTKPQKGVLAWKMLV